ncbi:MAG: hypothetical protein SGILL_005196 [Bacillariaceae sp.]
MWGSKGDTSEANLLVNFDSPSFSKCTNSDWEETGVDNDQGSKAVTQIYPLSYCVNTEIKWKDRSKGDVEPPIDSNDLFTTDATIAVKDISENDILCDPPITDECADDIDCLAHPDHDVMFCPQCIEGMCINRPEPNGNLNCCKRTPGNDLVITNGCGANNICFGFNDHDQCEVNQHAAYCHPSCMEGNLDSDGNIIGDGTCGGKLENDQGSKGMPKVFPMGVCKCTDVKFKTSGAFSEIPQTCDDFPAVYYAEPTTEETTTDDVAASNPDFCETGKMSFKCGNDVFTCGFGGSTNVCSHHAAGGSSKVEAIDNSNAFTDDYSSLCAEIEGMIQQDFDDGGFANIQDIKCGEEKVRGTWHNAFVSEFACYDGSDAVWWEWTAGTHLEGSSPC